MTGLQLTVKRKQSATEVSSEQFHRSIRHYSGPLGSHGAATIMATSSSQIFTVNPYENHPGLTQVEADTLWEYAKLNQHIKDVRIEP